MLLVRHGETEWNRNGQFQGQIDVPLNDNGRAQGEKAAEFLKEVPLMLPTPATWRGLRKRRKLS
jgi:broad specificity phosphatase PhoE